MSNFLLFSHPAALQVIQQAVVVLAKWAKADSWLTRNSFEALNQKVEAITDSVVKAQEMMGWAEHQQLDCLQLVFDQIQLSHQQNSPHFHPARALNAEAGAVKTPPIPYARSDRPSNDDLEKLKKDIQAEVEHLNFQNLSQLTMFVEKFGSHLSFGEPDIALIDLARSTAAVAAALAQHPPDDQVALIAGDLMGVQKFIYTISSDGALKSLRARSFYLELVTEEIVQQLLDALGLPRTNVIYAGASKFYLLVAATDALKEILERTQEDFNDWLLKTFQRKVFLAIAHESFSVDRLQSASGSKQTPLAQIWQQVNDKLAAQATHKFVHQLDTILDPQPSHQPCKVCHRDDVRRLTRLKRGEPDSVEACAICARMFRLGGQLLRVKAIVRSSRRNVSPTRLRLKLKSGTIYHYLFNDPKEALRIAADDDLVLLVNDWDLNHYQTSQVAPLLYANYAQSSKVEFEENDQTKPGTMRAEEFAQEAEGIKRVGYLRMDVDRLSQIFSEGLGEKYTLPRLTSLSRQMTYFFKVYLNSLADKRQHNFIDYCDALNFQRLPRNPPNDPQKDPDKNLRENLLFIYAGGDDLFVSGAWDEVVAFAFDVYQAFRAYTGNHPDITLSGGISLDDAKYPLYQAASDAGHAEDNAKANGRDSLGLFGEVFKWSEWLGAAETTVLAPEDQKYLETEIKPHQFEELFGVKGLFGVLPFVKRLDQQLEVNQSRSFVRNLLATAQVQTQMLREIEDQKSLEAKDIRYFLHLPKIAYTIARLPSRVRDDPNFDPVRTSLKSPYNAPYFRAIATWLELLKRT